MQRINGDPRVRRHLNSPPQDDASAFVQAALEHWREHGFGLFAVEDRRPGRSSRCLGFVGAGYSAFAPDYADTPELAWRLDPDCWGRGLATEAAAAARDHAFTAGGLDAVVAMIRPRNERSRRVALKLGMRQVGETWNETLGRQTDVWRLEVGEWASRQAAEDGTRSAGAR